MTVSVVVQARGLDRVRRVLAKLSYLDTRDLLDNVGALIASQVQTRITGQEGPPEGGKWKEYTPDYKRWKASKGKLKGKGKGFLRLTGALEEAVEHQVGRDEVEIGTTVKYGAANQATRPFLGLTDRDEDDIEELTVDWLRKRMGIL